MLLSSWVRISGRARQGGLDCTHTDLGLGQHGSSSWRQRACPSGPYNCVSVWCQLGSWALLPLASAWAPLSPGWILLPIPGAWNEMLGAAGAGQASLYTQPLHVAGPGFLTAQGASG